MGVRRHGPRAQGQTAVRCSVAREAGRPPGADRRRDLGGQDPRQPLQTSRWIPGHSWPA